MYFQLLLGEMMRCKGHISPCLSCPSCPVRLNPKYRCVVKIDFGRGPGPAGWLPLFLLSIPRDVTVSNFDFARWLSLFSIFWSRGVAFTVFARGPAGYRMASRASKNSSNVFITLLSFPPHSRTCIFFLEEMVNCHSSPRFTRPNFASWHPSALSFDHFSQSFPFGLLFRSSPFPLPVSLVIPSILFFDLFLIRYAVIFSPTVHSLGQPSTCQSGLRPFNKSSRHG